MIVHRILHVEAVPDIAEAVIACLASAPDLETRHCGSGAEALDIAAQWSPDLILMGITSDNDGRPMLACLKGNARTVHIPVVVMTGAMAPGELDLLRSRGTVGVIAKPVDPSTLANAIRRHLDAADDGLGALRGIFLRRVSDESLALALCRPAFDGNSISPDVLAKVRDIAHGLAGAGGVFGFPEVSETAGALEEAIVIERRGTGSIAEVTLALDRLISCIAPIGSGKRQPTAMPDAQELH